MKTAKENARIKTIIESTIIDIEYVLYWQSIKYRTFV